MILELLHLVECSKSFFLLNMIILSAFCYISLWWLSQASSDGHTYRGAVVEYHPNLEKDEGARVAANVAKYTEFMKMAKEKRVDIIVFPENGLRTISTWSPIPDPVDRISPCDSNFPTTEAVKNLSCASKNNGIYSVVNLLEKRACKKDDKLCPPRGFYLHNTNVAFDRKGVVVARYSKFNLYDEPMVNKTEKPEIVFFDTDFNVRFGMFTCFDIMFPTPALSLVSKYNVTNYVYTTHWFSELPFLTALQTQRGWAETHNVNFLASGMNYPRSGSFGSGIFNGKFGDLVQIMPEKAGSQMLIAEIPKIPSNEPITQQEKGQPVVISLPDGETEPSSSSSPSSSSTTTTPKPDPGVQLLRDQMELFQSEIIKPGSRFDRKICSGNSLCCDFKVSVTSLNRTTDPYVLRAVAFHGVRRFGMSFRGGIQCCGVVMCKGPHIMNCTSRAKNVEMFRFTEIQLTGNFQLENSFQMPTTLVDKDQLEPLSVNKYTFKKSKKGNSMEVSLELLWPVTDLQAFGIWGRDFSLDMKSSAVVHNRGLFATSLLALVIASLGWLN